MAAVLDRVVAGAVASARWLALPVVLLLFAQWPLREWIRAGSREANDLGQCAFALFVAVAVTAATRAGQHLTPENLSGRYSSSARRRLGIAAPVLVLIPWSLFVLITGFSSVASSVRVLERFPETGNAGYFAVKVAALLLAALILVQAVLDVVAGCRRR